jgi:hypothetical protein
MSSKDVDEYVAAKLEPWQREIVEALRALVREAAPRSTELITYGSPGWKGGSNKLLAIVSPSKKHVVLSFSRGAELHDVHGLLEGSGKVTRHVKIRDVADIDPAALQDYLTQAVKIDES